MQSYIDKLKAETTAEQARLEQAKLSKRTDDSRVVCDKPLTEQIEELMRSLPPAERQRKRGSSAALTAWRRRARLAVPWWRAAAAAPSHVAPERPPS